ncbi:hypothetical protein M5K25_000672 [Dendrobium thyrsiflorum]|uniref:Uncharacterized protein n=1 Tax=Dendrobium thyrsiflorum TaxID=117978 RepID=A0ABD0W655_DENTH
MCRAHHTLDTGGGSILPLLNCTWAISSCSGSFSSIFSSESAIVVSGDSSVGSESPPKFIRSICDATSGSDSPSSGKYRSSSELLVFLLEDFTLVGFEELAWSGRCVKGLLGDGIPWTILQGVDRHSECHHGSSFEPVSDVLDCWGRISEKPYRMSRPSSSLLLYFLLHLYEVLASRFAFLSTGTFRQRIPEPGVQVSHPDAHRVGLPPDEEASASYLPGADNPVGKVVVLAAIIEILPPETTLLAVGASDWESRSNTETFLRGCSVVGRGAGRCTRRIGASVGRGLLAGFSELAVCGATPAILAVIAGRSTVPNWIVAPHSPVESWLPVPVGLSLGCSVAPSAHMKGFDAIGEHTGAGHNHNLVVPFGGESPGSEGPSHNRLSCGAIWRQNRRLEDTYHVLTGKRKRRTGFPSHRAGEERV